MYFSDREMSLIEITLFIFNILMILAIIGVYVALSRAIKQQGDEMRIIIHSEREAFKEAMSPAQRWTRARKYRDAQNGLMPSWNQPKDNRPIMSMSTTERGDRPMSYLMLGGNEQTAIDPIDALKSGANAIGDAGFDTSVSVPDTSALPAETQTGVIDNSTATTDANFSSNPRVNPSFLETSTTFAPNEGGQERYRALRK